MRELEHACDLVQDALWKYFWNEDKQYLNQRTPYTEEDKFIYWWQAHAVDVLMDGYLRTGDSLYIERIEKLYDGVLKENGGTFIHNWVDDMEWWALALLRLWDVTGDEKYLNNVKEIWEDIKTAWNAHMGGGIAWQKKQLDYKNTPANAPAAMIAFRLYRRFKNPEDLKWGEKIYNWTYENLVDKETGFVWDGMNRLGDGKIDYAWEFTYNQGVFMQAALEYYRITGNYIYKAAAVKTCMEAERRLAKENNGIFPYEGPDDCGLFRGIYFRYAYELYEACPELSEVKAILMRNAEAISEKGMSVDGLTGPDFSKTPEGTVDMAQHLSSMMALEMAWKAGRIS